MNRDLSAANLLSLLHGKALEAYQYLSPVESKDYSCVKRAFLKEIIYSRKVLKCFLMARPHYILETGLKNS